MNTAAAERVVIGTTAATVALTTVKHLADGETPPPRIYAGGLVVAVGLVLLSRPFPTAAASFAAIVLFATLASSTDTLDAIRTRLTE